jgi:hypothetical protein
MLPLLLFDLSNKQERSKKQQEVKYNNSQAGSKETSSLAATT